jgi:hypothetical protein
VRRGGAGSAQLTFSSPPDSRVFFIDLRVTLDFVSRGGLCCRAGQDWVAARSVVNAGQSASVPAPQPLCAGQSGRFRFEVFVTAPRILFFAVVFRRSSSFRC